FGLLLAAASFFMWRRHEIFADLGQANQRSTQALACIAAVLRPISAWIFASGLMMASLTVAILYYQLGHAPPQEPISGYFTDSWVDSIFLAVLWGLISLGALLLPVAIVNWNTKVATVVRFSWTVAGVLLVLFSAMNYFTHIGLLMNTADSF